MAEKQTKGKEILFNLLNYLNKLTGKNTNKLTATMSTGDIFILSAVGEEYAYSFKIKDGKLRLIVGGKELANAKFVNREDYETYLKDLDNSDVKDLKNAHEDGRKYITYKKVENNEEAFYLLHWIQAENNKDTKTGLVLVSLKGEEVALKVFNDLKFELVSINEDEEDELLEETNNENVEKDENLTNKIKETTEEVKEKVNEIVEDVKEEINELKEEIKEEITEVKEDATEAVEEVKEVVKKARRKRKPKAPKEEKGEDATATGECNCKKEADSCEFVTETCKCETNVCDCDENCSCKEGNPCDCNESCECKK